MIVEVSEEAMVARLRVEDPEFRNGKGNTENLKTAC